MEKITYLPNGQWKLEKAKRTNKERSGIKEWIRDGERKGIENLKPAEGRERMKALKTIGSQTDTRINPDTGAKEYLLYRASHSKDWKPREDQISSWTTNKNFALDWGWHTSDYGEDPSYLHHAWVPEEYIHSYLTGIVGSKNPQFGEEEEVMLYPHNLNIHNTELIKDPDGEFKFDMDNIPMTYDLESWEE